MPLSGIRFSRRKRASREDLKHESSAPPQTCPPLPAALPEYSKLPALPSDKWTNIFQHLRHRAAEADDPLVFDTPPGQVDLSRMMRVNKVRVKLLFCHCEAHGTSLCVPVSPERLRTSRSPGPVPDLFVRSVPYGDNSRPALLTLHCRDVVLMELAGRCYAAGCRIRFVLQPEPRPNNARRQAQADTPPGTFSDLEEQLREIRLMVGAAKKLPEWEHTDMELVILPVDTAIFAQVRLSDSTTRPVLSAQEWDSLILKEARASVSSSLAQMGVTSGEKTIRVITSISESPWRDRLCTDDLDE